MIDRKAIIERVAKERYGGWSYIGPIEKNNRLGTVEDILEAAGFFDLLEAAEAVAVRRGTGSKAARADYMGTVPDSELWALHAAIARAKGDS